MIRLLLATTAAASLAACTSVTPLRVSFGGPPQVSGQSPAAAQSGRSEPQPAGSLPPGAEGLGAGPIATSPDIASVSVSRAR